MTESIINRSIYTGNIVQEERLQAQNVWQTGENSKLSLNKNTSPLDEQSVNCFFFSRIEDDECLVYFSKHILERGISINLQWINRRVYCVSKAQASCSK